MKTTKLFSLIIATLVGVSQSAWAGHGGGGGFGGGGHFGGFGGGQVGSGHFGGFRGGGFGAARASGGFARPSMGPSFHAMPMQTFGGGRMIHSAPRFPSAASRPVETMRTSPRYVNPNVGSTRARQFATGRFSNPERDAHSRTAINRSAQLRGGNNLRADWRNHVFARHDADWHRGWDRNREHWWNGHRCRFVDGSWVVFDAGFDPWWPYWWDYPYGYYGYPYDYYYGAPSDYYNGYPYDYYNYYDDHPDNSYHESSYPGSSEGGKAVVSSVQSKLTNLGYYKGSIDGVLGDETEAVIARYQEDHDLSVTGTVTAALLHALGLG